MEHEGERARAVPPVRGQAADDTRRGLFVVLDGVDGCGKTTQATRLAAAVTDELQREAVHVREPGTTRVGEALRSLLLARDLSLAPRAEVLLFAAARAQTLHEVVAPALARGAVVVCERFHASTFAYQGVAGGQGEDDVLALLARWAGAPAPDLEIVLDLEPERALARRAAARDRIEDKGLEFQRAVARGYRRYLELAPRAVRIDADRAPQRVADDVLAEVRRALG